MVLKEKNFENIVGKGENADNLHFVLFLQCFMDQSNHRQKSFEPLSLCCLQMLSISLSSKFSHLVRISVLTEQDITFLSLFKD